MKERKKMSEVVETGPDKASRLALSGVPPPVQKLLTPREKQPEVRKPTENPRLDLLESFFRV